MECVPHPSREGLSVHVVHPVERANVRHVVCNACQLYPDLWAHAQRNVKHTLIVPMSVSPGLVDICQVKCVSHFTRSSAYADRILVFCGQYVPHISSGQNVYYHSPAPRCVQCASHFV